MTARMQSMQAGSSKDPDINGILQFAKDGFGDTEMFGLIARRPELLKRTAAMFSYFLAGQGGLIEPELLEMMRLRGANLNACTYCATVRLQPVAGKVQPVEAALELRDISKLNKSQAVASQRPVHERDFSPRQRAALALVDKIIVDPHGVDNQLYAELRKHFSEEEIIELVCASALFTWAGTLNTVVHLETGESSVYGKRGGYAAA